MRTFAIVAALAIMTATAVFVPTAIAQEGPGGQVNPGRDCQTVVQCRFTRGGVYRGCISAYSCRVCRFVTSRQCTIPGARGTCRRLECSWG